MRTLLLLALLGVPAVVPAADELKIAQLEQDIRDLQRQVQALARQVEAPRAGAPLPPAPARPAGSAAPTQLPGWVDASKWQRVQPGMDELQVLQLLGQPTSMRNQDGARVLLYALQIGPDGFLAGSVTLRDRAVAAVQVPRLQ